MPSISERFRPASDIASSAALLIRSSVDEPSCLPNAVRPTPVIKLMACVSLLRGVGRRFGDAIAYHRGDFCCGESGFTQNLGAVLVKPWRQPRRLRRCLRPRRGYLHVADPALGR